MPRKRRAATTDGPKDVLTAREAAKYLRLALPTFYRYMWQGKIPADLRAGNLPLPHVAVESRQGQTQILGGLAGGQDILRAVSGSGVAFSRHGLPVQLENECDTRNTAERSQLVRKAGGDAAE